MGNMAKALQERPTGVLPSNIIPNPREQINSITTRSSLTTVGPSIPYLVPPTPREEVEKELETLMDEVHITSSRSTAHVPPPISPQVSPPKPKEDPKPNPHQPPIPYPSRLKKEKLLDKYDSENTPIYAHCSAILLNKLPEKLGDPGKFLIPWMGDLKPTRMSLELANRSVAYPICIAEDVLVRVDKFIFPADFVVIDFEIDMRVPLILGRPFLRTVRALVDLYEEKLTLRIRNEELVFRMERASKCPSKCDSHSVHCIDVVDYSSDKIHIQKHQSCGSTTSYFKLSLPDYEVFYFEFADGLSHTDPFPPGDEDDDYDPEF
ncbi:reverse transcriptase domain-containing protein [Tanacetum coccineum]